MLAVKIILIALCALFLLITAILLLDLKLVFAFDTNGRLELNASLLSYRLYDIKSKKPSSKFGRYLKRIFGTGRLPDEQLTQIVREVFDLRPYHITKRLDLKRPIYSKTSSYGHFGRERPEFTWEKRAAVADLLTAAKM